MRRMDRYQTDEDTQLRRMAKNQNLYQNVSTNVIYTNITDVTNANAYEISNPSDSNHYTTREDYQKMQKYQNVENMPKSKRELADFNYLYQRKENRVYDINSVLEEARKNRQDIDEKEAKRRIKNAYNILSGMNKKELERYREEKKKRIMTPEEEEIRELIDTIASKTLAGEIDKATSVDLLSDLMATNMMDKVDASEQLSKSEEDASIAKEEIAAEESAVDTVEEEEEEEDENTTDEKTNDFYSKSMDLSDNDLELSEDFKEGSLPLGVKILIFLVILGIIAFAIFFIYQRIP